MTVATLEDTVWSNWVDDSSASCSTTVTASLDGRTDVLRMVDNNAGGQAKSDLSLGDNTIPYSCFRAEFYIYPTAYDKKIFFNPGYDIRIEIQATRIRVSVDGTLQTLQSGAQNLNEWYKFEIESVTSTSMKITIGTDECSYTHTEINTVTDYMVKTFTTDTAVDHYVDLKTTKLTDTYYRLLTPDRIKDQIETNWCLCCQDVPSIKEAFLGERSNDPPEILIGWSPINLESADINDLSDDIINEFEISVIGRNRTEALLMFLEVRDILNSIDDDETGDTNHILASVPSKAQKEHIFLLLFRQTLFGEEA